MINLLPPQAKKSITTEYWVRVVTVFMFILSAVGLIMALLMLPVYVLVSSQVSAYSASAEEATDKVAQYDLSATSIVNTNKKAEMLVQLREVDNFSNIVDTLEYLKGGNVVISSYEFLREENIKIGSVLIGGRAETRQDLIDFRDVLLEQAEILSAELPISNLTKDKDIPFSITIEIADSEN